MTAVAVGFDVLSDEEKGALQQTLGRGKLPAGALAQVKNVICVASGKGGVGKSTMTANLAAALTAEGHPAGALDCDVYGYSIPRMLGVNRKPEVNGERKILPLEAAGGVKVMSIGFFVEENSAVVWRGPMLHKAIQQFLEDVAWGELEYLLLDLPPGTGDVSMTLAQLLPQAKFLIVTTPQPAAQTVAKRGAEMALKFDLELLGAIENMSGFTTPDGERFTIFGEGGGQLLADELDIPLLGKVPLSEALREHADAGTPLVTAEPDSPASQAIRQAARGIVAATPQELPVLQAYPAMAEAPPVGGIPLPVVQADRTGLTARSARLAPHGRAGQLPIGALELAHFGEAEAFVAAVVLRVARPRGRPAVASASIPGEVRRPSSAIPRPLPRSVGVGCIEQAQVVVRRAALDGWRPGGRHSDVGPQRRARRAGHSSIGRRELSPRPRSARPRRWSGSRPMPPRSHPQPRPTGSAVRWRPAGARGRPRPPSRKGPVSRAGSASKAAVSVAG